MISPRQKMRNVNGFSSTREWMNRQKTLNPNFLSQLSNSQALNERSSAASITKKFLSELCDEGNKFDFYSNSCNAFNQNNFFLSSAAVNSDYNSNVGYLDFLKRKKDFDINEQRDGCPQFYPTPSQSPAGSDHPRRQAFFRVARRPSSQKVKLAYTVGSKDNNSVKVNSRFTLYPVECRDCLTTSASKFRSLLSSGKEEQDNVKWPVIRSMTEIDLTQVRTVSRSINGRVSPNATKYIRINNVPIQETGSINSLSNVTTNNNKRKAIFANNEKFDGWDAKTKMSTVTGTNQISDLDVLSQTIGKDSHCNTAHPFKLDCASSALVAHGLDNSSETSRQSNNQQSKPQLNTRKMTSNAGKQELFTKHNRSLKSSSSGFTISPVWKF